MTGFDEARAWAALRGFAREGGRSVAVRVEVAGETWSADVAGEVPRPAASLLKIPLGMAAEVAGDLAPEDEVPVGEVLAGWSEPSMLRAFDPDRWLRVRELVRLMVSSSDGAAARWVLGRLGVPAVESAARVAGCVATQVRLEAGARGGELVGWTTAIDALAMLGAAVDASRYPLVAAALAASTTNSRIPLGVRDVDVRIAHKTGTLRSVAHDVALLQVGGGEVWLAFLADEQHDTLVTGYEMGLCARELLDAFGLRVTASRSLMGSP